MGNCSAITPQQARCHERLVPGRRSADDAKYSRGKRLPATGRHPPTDEATTRPNAGGLRIGEHAVLNRGYQSDPLIDGFLYAIRTRFVTHGTQELTRGPSARGRARPERAVRGRLLDRRATARRARRARGGTRTPTPHLGTGLF